MVMQCSYRCSSVGGQSPYDALVSMIPATSTQTYSYIHDLRLKANGFEVSEIKNTKT